MLFNNFEQFYNITQSTFGNVILASVSFDLIEMQQFYCATCFGQLFAKQYKTGNLLWLNVMCTDYTFLGALLAVVVFSLSKSTLDVILKPAPASNPYVLLYLHREP